MSKIRDGIVAILALFGLFMLISLTLACTSGSCQIGFNDKVLFERKTEKS